MWTPAIDVERDNGNLVIHADLPGIKPEEVKIEVEDDILTVSGEHEERRDRSDDPLPEQGTEAAVKITPTAA